MIYGESSIPDFVHGIPSHDHDPLRDNGTFVDLPFQNRVISVLNVDCDDGLTVTLEIWDADGGYQVLNGTDSFSYDLPDAFPFNVTATATQYNTSMYVYITGEEPIVYTLGDGTGGYLAMIPFKIANVSQSPPSKLDTTSKSKSALTKVHAPIL